MDVQDEDLMRRFLVDDVTPQERTLIEDRFIADEAYFEALSALETDMMLAYRRGDLPSAWRERFEAHLRRSAGAAQRLQAFDAFRTALTSATARDARVAKVEEPSRPWRFPWQGWGLVMAGSAAVAAVALGGWWLTANRPAMPAAVATSPSPARSGAVATFVLLPGPTRADQASSNSFRIPPGTDQVQLKLSVPAPDTAGSYGVALRAVGGDTLPIRTAPVTVISGNTLEVRWTIPAPQVPAGDYILTLSDQTNDRGSATIATRAFSIVE